VSGCWRMLFPQVSGLTLAHPSLTPSRSPSPTAVSSTNRLTLRGSILGPWPARPKWAHTTVSFPGCTAREGKSALNVTLNWALPPPTPASHLLFHQPLSPSAVNRGRPPSYLLLLRIVRFVFTIHSFWCYTRCIVVAAFAFPFVYFQ
jgi:hypothetical protein